MIIKRPFKNYSIIELELNFAKIRNDRAGLIALLQELHFRTTTRAQKLLIQVKHCIVNLDKGPIITSKITSSASPIPVDLPILKELVKGNNDDGPDKILTAWTALEVLSPQSFSRPEQLAQNGDSSLIKYVNNGPLPWTNGGERSKVNYQIYYHVVLGSIRLPEAVKSLLQVFEDSREELPMKTGEAVLASLLVNKNGILVEEGGVSISSFGWGVANTLQGKLRQLGEWKDAESKLNNELLKRVDRRDEHGEKIPVNVSVIDGAVDWLTNKLGLQANLVNNKSFTVKIFHYYKNAGSPDPLLLNSFYLEDLSLAKKLFSSNKATPNLKRYLGALAPDVTYDLLHRKKDILDQVIGPANFPSARWPGPGRHPLVLLQQAAVNIALGGLKPDGILAVNGPPGTGKTTLLRDIVTGLVVDRARQMVTFDDPKNAFSNSGEKINVGNAWLYIYNLDNKLRGYEMLVASSNNKAVENVSSELPDINAIAEDSTELRYFKTLSDAVHEKETWGMCAAVLGNGANKAKFIQRFWWDKDNGFWTYLNEAIGKPQFIEEEDSNTGVLTKRKPKIIVNEKPPTDPESAITAWKAAANEFREIIKKVDDRKAEVVKIRNTAKKLPALLAKAQTLDREVKMLEEQRVGAEAEIKTINGLISSSDLSKKQLENKVLLHGRTRPGFFARIFQTKVFLEWRLINTNYFESLGEVLDQMSDHSKRKSAIELILTDNRKQLLNSQKASSANLKEIDTIREILKVFSIDSSGQLVDDDFWNESHEVIQMSSTWFNSVDHRLRDDVFTAALKVHKAFIDASAQYLRHNLGVMMMVLSGKDFSEDSKRNLLGDLWATLFLIVPCISTTFASVGRMLKDVPEQSLGYVLIDEAGQALPQAAIGALMRTQKAIVVGDPVQIEPVVTLPESLTRNIMGEFNVEADRFNAPEASVQTLADLTSPYIAEFDSLSGTRTVGVPLLVHRRCAEPMFAISNKIGYGDQMVQAKTPKSSAIKEVLGQSNWFDISGHATDKWSPQEGEVVMNLLQRLKNAGVSPDIYIVSPFLVVAENIRVLIMKSKIMDEWVANRQSWPFERVGTVHTVQGREAEAVIFVLGAPLEGQSGARRWAASRPNLLNVAVTRAKETLYVVGNRKLWSSAGVFQELHAKLPLENH